MSGLQGQFWNEMHLSDKYIESYENLIQTLYDSQCRSSKCVIGRSVDVLLWTFNIETRKLEGIRLDTETSFTAIPRYLIYNHKYVFVSENPDNIWFCLKPVLSSYDIKWWFRNQDDHITREFEFSTFKWMFEERLSVKQFGEFLRQQRM